MKPAIIFLGLAIGLGVLGEGWAQASKTTPMPGPSSAKKSSLTANTGFSIKNSNMHAVNLKIRAQMRQIQKDLKSGKINREEAKAQWAKLKSVRKQELEYFKQNGQKEISLDQKQRLDQSLGQN